MDVPSALFGDLLVAYRTFPFLFVPESNELSPFEPALEPLESNSLVKVGFPSRIIWVGFTLNQAVSSDTCFCCLAEVNRQSFSFLFLYFASELPPLLVIFVIVFVLYPLLPLFCVYF